jgi:hypothetical protein
MDGVGYWRQSIYSAERLQFSEMMLKKDDVRGMFVKFGQHSMFSTIELDVLLLRSSEDILKRLIRLDEEEVVLNCIIII